MPVRAQSPVADRVPPSYACDILMRAPRTVFACQECGAQSPKWVGKCPDCNAWNSFIEEKPLAAVPESRGAATPLGGRGARLYADVDTADTERLSTGISEFDRVLGGGVVPGSLVLLGGEPGIGKSTLLLQAASHFAAHIGPVLYCSGEESEHQIKARGDRLGVVADRLYLLAETCVERLFEEVDRIKPSLLVVDSIQTVFSLKLQSAPGSVSQVRQAATDFLFTAKGRNLPTVLVGHITKDGSLAGPKVLEHVVDTVLYFEGEQHHAHRIVRAVKNRFGAVSELGVFEMTGEGLVPVANPSKLFLAERPSNVPGSSVLCTIEGSRPILVEVQALVSSATFGNAQRTANGLDRSRLSLLLAVLDKRVGLNLASDDVFVNVAGGLSVDEPAADLAVLASVASSLRNRAIASDVVVFGEVGLAGEVRSTTQAALRVREAAQLGFTRCVLPRGNVAAKDVPAGMTIEGVRTVAEALDALM
jgi:DNA repair protein RadA/Sms